MMVNLWRSDKKNKNGIYATLNLYLTHAPVSKIKLKGGFGEIYPDNLWLFFFN